MSNVIPFGGEPRPDSTGPEYTEADIKGDPGRLDEAVALLEIEDEDDQRETRQELLKVAANYIALCQFDAEAPRAKGIREWLEKIEELSGELRRALDAPPCIEGEQILYVEDIDPDMNLRARLDALSISAHRASAEYKDQGGNTKPIRRRRGAPKAALTIDCACVYQEWRHDGSGSRDGPFAQLVRAVYEAGTGDGADENGSGLDTYIKKAGKVLSKIGNIDKALKESASDIGEGEQREATSYEIRLFNARAACVEMFQNPNWVFDTGEWERLERQLAGAMPEMP